MTERLIETLSDMGIDADLVDRRMSQTAHEVGRATFRKLFAVLSYLRRAARYRASKYDLVIIFLADRGPSFLIDEIALRLIAVRHDQTILYLHSANVAKLSNSAFIGWRVRKRLRSAQGVVTLNDILASQLSLLVRADRMFVVPNSPNVPSEFLDIVDDTRNYRQPRFVFLANLIPAKGVLDFIECAALISREYPDAQFDICGGTSDLAFERAVDSAVRESIAASRIHVHGPVSGDRKWQVLRQASCLVFPSKHPQEAQPLAIIEALSQGVPVVAYDVGGLRAMANKRACLQTVERGNVGDLAAAAVVAAHSELNADARAAWKELYGPEAYRSAWRSILGATSTTLQSKEPQARCNDQRHRHRIQTDHGDQQG